MTAAADTFDSDLDRWTRGAAEVTFRTGVFLDGRFVAASSGATFASINPATEQVLAEVAAGDEVDVDRAVASARRAFEAGEWSRSDPGRRKAVLLRLADLVDEHLDELALIESLDTGMLIGDALGMAIPEAATTLRWYAESIDKLYDEIAPSGPGDVILVGREPLGVVGAIVPWNGPLLMATWKLAPILAAGNSLVLKPSEKACLTVLRFAELALEAGLPPGVLNVVPGLGERAGRAIGLHDDIDCVCFTGSTEVGKLLLQYAGQSNMKQVWLECGGKSPYVVFPDANLAAAATAAAYSIFLMAGQSCSASSRLLVHESIKDEFIGLVLEAARQFVPGNPLDPEATMGALIDREHADAVLHRIELARADGEPLVGGGPVLVDGRGCFVEPTIFDAVPAGSRLAQEEVFGPVLAAIGFASEEEAVSLANGTGYGLASAVWTNDLSRAHRMARAVRAGTVNVNTADTMNVAVPVGGFKQSGFGRDLSLHALEKYTGIKTTWIALS